MIPGVKIRKSLVGILASLPLMVLAAAESDGPNPAPVDAPTSPSNSSTHCQDRLCLSINIPSETASRIEESEPGPVFYQLAVPDTVSWAGFGQGEKLEKSTTLFTIYRNAAGDGVTVSARKNEDIGKPELDEEVDYAVLDGTGVRNGRLIANIRCNNCVSWSGGQMNVHAKEAEFVYVFYKGKEPIKSDSPLAPVHHFNKFGMFNLNMTRARGGPGNEANPFLDSSRRGGAPECRPPKRKVHSRAISSLFKRKTLQVRNEKKNDTAAATSVAKATSSREKQKSLTDGLPSCDSFNAADVSTYPVDLVQLRLKQRNKISRAVLIAHGAVGALAVAVVLPFGATLVRVLSYRQGLYLHIFLQILGVAMVVASAGLGVTIARTMEMMKHPHSVLGLILVGLMLLQPIVTRIPNPLYRIHRTRDTISHAHIWSGRILILLGVITGGIGFQTGNDPREQARTVAYVGISAFMMSAYALGIFWSEKRYMQEMRARRDRGREIDGIY